MCSGVASRLSSAFLRSELGVPGRVWVEGLQFEVLGMGVGFVGFRV